MRYVRPFRIEEPSDAQLEWLIAPEEAAECTIRIARQKRDAGPRAPSPDERFLFVLTGYVGITDAEIDTKAGPAELIFIPPGAKVMLTGEHNAVWLEIEATLPAGVADPPKCQPSVVKLDQTKFEGEGFTWQVMADRRQGAQSLRLNVVKVKQGSGSPDFHIHAFGQVYVIQKGTMTIDIGRARYHATANTLVYLPPGVVHRNFNASNDLEQHMSLLLPEPQHGQVFDYAITIHEHEAKMLMQLPS